MTDDVNFIQVDTIETRHGFFERNGGLSTGVYGSLNCAFGSKDNLSDVMTNRALVLQALGGDVSDLLSAAQVHSNRVETVTRIWTRERAPEVDAMVTATPGIALGILTADCAPVLFADMKNRVIGAAHAGWKGAFGGVLENTVGAMEALGAERGHIHAAVGPCIHQASYEVDHGFRQNFINYDPDYGGYFVPSDKDGHFRFDLPGFVQDRLTALSLGSVSGSSVDTYPAEKRFFSYRRTTHRNEADYGRQISVIALEG